MTQAIRRSFWSVLLWSLISNTASAQDSISISGTVTTRADGVTVPGAIVTVVGVDVQATTDANGRYNIQVPRTGLRRERIYLLAIGVQNLFNVLPDRNSTVNSFNVIQTFPSHSPFGMNGRALYARIGWNF